MIDFLQISSVSDLYNFHSHTQFCDGHATMDKFAAAALAAKFTDYGFSPHSPLPINSPCNMKTGDVDEYLAEVERLKDEYAGRIRLYASMEIDYLDEQWGPSVPYFDTLGLDYKIGSVHFIPCGDTFVDTDGHFDNFKIKMSRFFDNDIRHVVDTFYDQTLRMIAAGGFDIIGHFDKIGQNASYFRPGIEDEAWYGQRVSEVIDAIKAAGLIVEINTKSLTEHNRFFPGKRYFSRLKKEGIPVVFNSDAHYPHLINAGRFEAIEMFRQAKPL